MKLLLLFCMAVVGSISAQSCSGRPNGTFLPDARRCNFYFSCNNGMATSLNCPSGYHYNPLSSICDVPSRAGCIACPSSGFRNVAVAGACNKFIQCFQGVATDRECPKGLLFDSSFGQCNLQKNVKC